MSRLDEGRAPKRCHWLLESGTDDGKSYLNLSADRGYLTKNDLVQLVASLADELRRREAPHVRAIPKERRARRDA